MESTAERARHARPQRRGPALTMASRGVLPQYPLLGVVLLPLATAVLLFGGLRGGLYGGGVGLALFATVMVTSLLLALRRGNRASDRLEASQREALQSLRVSEARLAGIVSHSADAIISVDEEQRINLFNEGAEHIFGYARAEVLGQPMDLLVPERLREAHRRNIRDFAAGARTVGRMGERGPLLGLRKNGEEFPADATISKVEFEGQRSFTIILRDNTERQRAEETLRETEERFRTAYEDAPIGMALISLDGHWLKVNRSVHEMLGYSAQELLARTFQDITYPPDLESDLQSVTRLLRGELTSYQLEKRYIHRDGHLVSCLLTASLVRDSQDRPSYFISQIQDISSRKRMEQDWRFLAESGLQLAHSLDPRAMLGIVARLMVPALADGCVLEFVDGGERVLEAEGAVSEPAKQRPLHELLSLYEQEIFDHGPIVRRTLRTGASVLLPVLGPEMRQELGSARYVELLRQLDPRSVMVVPLLARGRTLGVMMLATSESGRRYDTRDLALVEELARRVALAIDNARLYRISEQATRTRDEVLRIVAHDLRTPLQVISLSTQALLKHVPEEPHADAAQRADRKALETIRRAVDRSTHLIQDLLDVASMEAGSLSLRVQPEDIVPLVQEVLELHRTLAEEKSLRIEVLLPERCPPLLVDRDRLMQIVSNLLGNAIKFTADGGEITVGVEPAGDVVRCWVRDTGPGIPAESLPHIFDPFWQASRGRKDGAGLGLAIVRGLVEAHGGRIRVESTPDVGSLFTFTLPVPGGGASAATQSPSQRTRSE